MNFPPPPSAITTTTTSTTTITTTNNNNNNNNISQINIFGLEQIELSSRKQPGLEDKANISVMPRILVRSKIADITSSAEAVMKYNKHQLQEKKTVFLGSAHILWKYL